jgi:hypothetical protein
MPVGTSTSQHIPKAQLRSIKRDRASTPATVSRYLDNHQTSQVPGGRILRDGSTIHAGTKAGYEYHMIKEVHNRFKKSEGRLENIEG